MAKGSSDTMITAFVEVILGIVLLTVGAGFITVALTSTDVTNVTGMSLLLPIIPLALGFGLIMKGVKAFKG